MEQGQEGHSPYVCPQETKPSGSVLQKKKTVIRVDVCRNVQAQSGYQTIVKSPEWYPGEPVEYSFVDDGVPGRNRVGGNGIPLHGRRDWKVDGNVYEWNWDRTDKLSDGFYKLLAVKQPQSVAAQSSRPLNFPGPGTSTGLQDAVVYVPAEFFELMEKAVSIVLRKGIQVDKTALGTQTEAMLNAASGETRQAWPKRYSSFVEAWHTDWQQRYRVGESVASHKLHSEGSHANQQVRQEFERLLEAKIHRSDAETQTPMELHVILTPNFREDAVLSFHCVDSTNVSPKFATLKIVNTGTRDTGSSSPSNDRAVGVPDVCLDGSLFQSRFQIVKLLGAFNTVQTRAGSEPLYWSDGSRQSERLLV
jgi:hypothetical protein